MKSISNIFLFFGINGVEAIELLLMEPSVMVFDLIAVPPTILNCPANKYSICYIAVS